MGAMRTALTLAALALALALALPAAASELELVPSPALRCLTPDAKGSAQPEYPFLAWKDGVPGRVRVELIFTTRDLEPEVKVLSIEGGPAFADAVKAHVRGFRVPCSEDSDFPVRLRQDYHFTPDGRRVQGGVPEDAADAERQRLLGCVVNIAKDKTPAYPALAQRSGQQGRVLAQLRFSAPDRPPELQLLAPAAAQIFLPEVREWAAQYRMPCHSGRPIATERIFLFRMEGSARFGFRELPLTQFLGSVRGIRQQRVSFDFNDMACPFELRLNYRQPLASNRVTEIGEPMASRRGFIAWLTTAELELAERAQSSVFGDNVLLQVPCARFELPSPAQPPFSPAPKE